MTDMSEREQMLAWAKKVGEYRLPAILDKFDQYRREMKEKAALASRAASTKGEANDENE